MKRLLVLFLILISSCSTIDYSNYEYLESKLDSSKKVSREVIKTNIQIEQSAFVYETFENEKDLNKIKYPFDGELEDPPFYYSFDKILSKVNKIHNGLISYNKILLSIANEKDELKDNVKEVNESVKVLEIDDNVVNISSILVYRTFDILTKEKRKQLLEELITKNQKYIQVISREMINILNTLEYSLYSSYDRYFYDLYLNQSIENNRKAIELTREYERQKSNIKKLKHFYKTLPSLHKKLLETEDFDYIEFGLDVSNDYSFF